MEWEGGLTLLYRPAWSRRDFSSRSRAAFSIFTFILSCTAAFSLFSVAVSFSLHRQSSHPALLRTHCCPFLENTTCFSLHIQLSHPAALTMH